MSTYVKSTNVTLPSNSKFIQVNDGANIGNIRDGWPVFINGGIVGFAKVVNTSATPPTIELYETYTGAGITSGVLSSFPSQGQLSAISDRITNLTTVYEGIADSVAINPAPSSIAKRDAGGKLKTMNATDPDDAVAFNQISQLQTDLAEANQNLAAVSSSVSTLANIYQDTASGLAATTNGQFFSVAGSGDVFVTLYYNDNGTAVAREVLPSKASVDSVSTQINTTKILALAGVVLP